MRANTKIVFLSLVLERDFSHRKQTRFQSRDTLIRLRPHFWIFVVDIIKKYYIPTETNIINLVLDTFLHVRELR